VVAINLRITAVLPQLQVLCPKRGATSTCDFTAIWWDFTHRNQNLLLDEERSYFQVILKIHPDFRNEGVKGPDEGVKGLGEGVKGLGEGVKGPGEGVKGPGEGVNKLYEVIIAYPGNRGPYYADFIHISKKTIERWIRILREKDLIEFKGSTRTGGYWPNAR
jgi:hypothetical protein